MPKELTALLADLTRVAQQMNDVNGKEQGRPVESETSTHEPDTAPASNEQADDLSKAAFQAGGLAISVDADKNNAMKVERIDVMPEPDGRVRVMVSVKKG
jgi:hypothetical protein